MSHSRQSENQRWLRRVSAVMLVVALAAGALSSGSSGTTAARPARATIARSQPVVGLVTSTQTCKVILVKHKRHKRVCRTLAAKGKNGGRHALGKQATLHLGDTITPPGGKATLKLSVPPGVSADNQLVYIKPAPGMQLNVLLQRSGQYTIVTINP
jgi:hypothetical protein